MKFGVGLIGAVALTACGMASASGTAADLWRTQRNAMLDANPNVEFDPTSLLVQFNPDSTEAERAALRALVRGEKIREYWLLPGLEHITVGLPVEQAIGMLETIGGANRLVQYAEPDYIVHTTSTFPNDPSFGNLWGLHNTGQTVNGDPGINDADIDAPEAWDFFTGDPNFAVIVIDTGIRRSHSDLSANTWVNPGEVASNGIDDDGNGYVDDLYGWDFYNNDANPDDDNGHGTHCAGTIGGRGNNGVGVAGVNWQIKMAAGKFLGAGGSGSISDAIEAVQYSTGKAFRVSNNSWGGGGYSTSMRNAIEASKAVGHIFVAAAGNANSNNDTSPFYPATYDNTNLISVAATNNNDGKASFSNYGATTVDLGAPGENIYSTYGSSYAYLSGTSMASPHVAGVVALVYGQNPSWSWSDVKNRIMSTTRPVSGLSGRCVTGGVVNAGAAIVAGNTAPVVTISSPTNGGSADGGTSVTFSGSATDTQDGNLTAGLIWTSNLQGTIGTGGSFSRSDLVGGTHTITASVTDSGGLTGSNSITFTINVPTVPNAPSNLRATVGGLTVYLDWTDNSNNETSFQLSRQQRVGGTWTNTTNITLGANTTFYWETPGTGQWRYRIRASNAVGNSAWTPWVRARVK